MVCQGIDTPKAFVVSLLIVCANVTLALSRKDQVEWSEVLSKQRWLSDLDGRSQRHGILPRSTHLGQSHSRLLRQTQASTGSSAGSGSSTKSNDATPGLPSRCPQDCTKYGTCNEELGRCDCPLGRTGADCSQLLSDSERAALCTASGHTNLTCGVEVEPPLCLNACNFRGRCVGGFCHCRPGFFGADCSLSLAAAAAGGGGGSGSGGSAAGAAAPAVELLAGQGYTLRPSGPRIYVYELPPHLNIYPNLDRLDRPLMFMLWQRWLSAGLRVADPAAADFFFVPVRVRKAYDSERVLQALAYIRATWPHWDASGGARHIFVHTGDWGRDELSEDAVMLTRNATWLTHWGLARNHDFAGWVAAHRPGQDIVLPLMLQASVVTHYRLTRASPLHPAGPRPPRPRTLFFAGRVCGSRATPTANGTYPNCPNVLGKEDAYSAATRQRAFFHHHNRTNWKVVTRTRSSAADMVTSKFCLAPSGAGQGKRSVLAVLMGCVPVTVTDGLMQPFEPEMRWEGFAVDVRERDIGLMHELLERLSAEQVAAFQANLRCAAQHLFWSSMYGSVFGEDGRYDAFETLVQVLRMRAVYPTLGPEEYAYVDPAFAAFLNCQEPPAQQPSGGAADGPAASLPVARGIDGSVAVGDVSSGNATRGSGGAGTWPDVGELAKPGLQKILSDGSRPAPRVRHLTAAGGGGSGGAGAGASGVTRQALCSHSLLPSGPEASMCSRCVRRRGRLLNPGGTICCNSRELAKCPRLWD